MQSNVGNTDLNFDFNRIFHDTALSSDYRSVPMITATSYADVLEQMEEKRLGPNDKIYVVLKFPDQENVRFDLEYKNKADTYCLLLGTKDFFDKKFSQQPINAYTDPRRPENHDVGLPGCDFVTVFSIDQSPQHRCFMDTRGVSEKYREHGVMKQTTFNLLTCLERRYGNIDISSHTIHPATWKFFQEKNDKGEYPVIPNDLPRAMVFLTKSIHDLDNIHRKESQCSKTWSPVALSSNSSSLFGRDSARPNQVTQPSLSPPKLPNPPSRNQH